MRIDKNDLLRSILESFDRIDYIKTADIPNIELYMDQVTTLWIETCGKMRDIRMRTRL